MFLYYNIKKDYLSLYKNCRKVADNHQIFTNKTKGSKMRTKSARWKKNEVSYISIG